MTDSNNAVTHTAARHLRRTLRPVQVRLTRTSRRLTRRILRAFHRLAFDLQVRLSIAEPQRVAVRVQERR
jgi:hypothetical protein